MKKLILSAVFALACFTAQAKNEVIKNDDKKPKNKAKVVAKVVKEDTVSPGWCTVEGYISGSCDGVATAVGVVVTAENCQRAQLRLLLKLLFTSLC